MTDRKRTAIAGLVSGLFVAGAVYSAVPFMPVGFPAAVLFVVVATALMVWKGMRPSVLLMIWGAAAIVFAAEVVVADPKGWQGYEGWALVLGLWCAAFTVGPWLVGMAVLRHFMTPAAVRPSYKLEDLHSE